MMDSTNKLLARFCGAVLLLAGLGLAALVILIAERQLILRGGIERSVLIFSAIISIVGFVCCLIGFRLAVNRPNRYQSLLPPFGWYAIALVFVVLGPALRFLVIRQGDYEQLVGAACAIAFGGWCWKAGRVAAARTT
jgi:hypothetical protein